jgi:hypothetical protein
LFEFAKNKTAIENKINYLNFLNYQMDQFFIDLSNILSKDIKVDVKIQIDIDEDNNLALISPKYNKKNKTVIFPSIMFENYYENIDQISLNWVITFFLFHELVHSQIDLFEKLYKSYKFKSIYKNIENGISKPDEKFDQKFEEQIADFFALLFVVNNIKAKNELNNFLKYWAIYLRFLASAKVMNDVEVNDVHLTAEDRVNSTYEFVIKTINLL